MNTVPFPLIRSMKFEINGEVISYSIRLSSRSRTLRLSVCPSTGVVVTLPLRQPIETAEAFIRKNARWVAHQMARLRQKAAFLPMRWPYGQTLPYQGIEHTVIPHVVTVPVSSLSSSVARTPATELLVRVRRPTIESMRRTLRQWYAKQATEWIQTRAAALSARMGIDWKRILIRDNKRQWGSCSARGTLSFNYRLIMAPPPIIDYVVIHELAHRQQLNHSRRFWAIVGSHCADYPEACKWLRTYGPYLQL